MQKWEDLFAVGTTWLDNFHRTWYVYRHDIDYNTEDSYFFALCEAEQITSKFTTTGKSLTNMGAQLIERIAHSNDNLK